MCVQTSQHVILDEKLSQPDEKQMKEIEEHKKAHPEAYKNADPAGDLVRKNEGNDRSKKGRLSRWITLALQGSG